jgi:hypothetical protein
MRQEDSAIIIKLPSKATSNIIRAEFGKNRFKDYNCETEKINSSIFNNYFLNIADNIAQKIFT